MPKRKRGEDGVGQHEASGSATVLQKRAEEKIFHGRKVVQRSLKVAKGFERQKLARRQKTATQEKKEDEIARINNEIEALKNLNLESCAQTHLYKTFLKQKDVASSPRLPPSVAAASKPTLDTATANVTARLYNAKPVKDAIIGVVPTIRAALGLDNRPRVEKAAEVGSRENERSTSGQAQPQIASSKHTVQDDSLSDYYSVSDNEMFEEEDNQVPTGNGRADLDVSDDSEALAGLDARVAGSSDEDEPGDSAHLRDGAGSDASSQSSSVSEAAVNPPPPKRRESGKQNERATAKFMPSLTMGGYVEGSDSDPEPFDDQPQRKNRRGQRARQAIWEKKFGKGAKHLQKDAAKTGKGAGPGKRDEGWDPKRGAHSGSTAPSKGYKPRWQQDREQRKRSGEDAASGGNAMELGPRKASKKLSHEPQGLHPSWEAAKRVKEQKQQGASFSGRKMVFD